MKNLLKSALYVSLFAGLIAGCANNDDYDNPIQGGDPLAGCVEPDLTVNKTVSQVVAMSTSAVQVYPDAPAGADGDVIEAYVTSSDERGAFFKSISLQTLPADGPVVGFSVSVDATTLFGQGFYPGRKVYVKLNGLRYAKVDGSLKLGNEYRANPNAAIEVGRLGQEEYLNYLVPACAQVSEDQLVRTMTIAQALNDANLNTLIEVTGVQFADSNVGLPYYDEFDSNTIGGATNRNLMDITGSSIIFRTSGFANFAGTIIPGESGRVRGVLTKFAGTYQFLARYGTDVMLDQPRFDAAPPIVGNNISYGLYNENFESFAANNRIFPKAVNDPAVGARFWEVKLFGGNKYIQMTSFGGTAEVNRTLFIVPVDMTLANTLQFQTKAGYDNGAALRVYYTTNYTPGGDITESTLTDITSNFNIPAGLPNAYPTNFTASGIYNIPASVTGNGYFIFEYKGNGSNGVTTTMQIDNIIVN